MAAFVPAAVFDPGFVIAAPATKPVLGAVDVVDMTLEKSTLLEPFAVGLGPVSVFFSRFNASADMPFALCVAEFTVPTIGKDGAGNEAERG